MRIAFDLETDGLLNELTKIHIIAVRNVDTDEAYTYRFDELDEAFNHLDKATTLLGHNIIDLFQKSVRELL